MPNLKRCGRAFWTVLDRTFLVAVMVAIIASLAGVIYWGLIDTGNPLRVLKTPGGGVRDHAVNPKVWRGGTLQVVRHYCIDRQLSGEINRRIVDTVVFAYPRSDAYTEVGCYEGRIHTVDIPSILPNGRYTYKVTATYVVNPLRTVVVPLPEVPFEVVDEPPSRPRRR